MCLTDQPAAHNVNVGIYVHVCACGEKTSCKLEGSLEDFFLVRNLSKYQRAEGYLYTPRLGYLHMLLYDMGGLISVGGGGRGGATRGPGLYRYCLRVLGRKSEDGHVSLCLRSLVVVRWLLMY